MKTQHETLIQFSGYPLVIVEEKPKRRELTVVKSVNGTAPTLPPESLANNPQYWDVEWFNSYE